MKKDQMKDKIIHLPGEQWKGTVVPIGYTTKMYYDDRESPRIEVRIKEVEI